jgi:hypothetical protein
LAERGASYIGTQEICLGVPVMSHNTMTNWIEIADQRRFCQAVLSERPPRLGAGRSPCRTSAIFSLPSRIVDALASRCAQRRRAH